MFEQKDIAMLILIVSVSFVASFFIAGAVISTPEDRAETVIEVDEFDPEFPTPSPRVFNDQALNPTDDISIGETTSDNPFTDQ